MINNLTTLNLYHILFFALLVLLFKDINSKKNSKFISLEDNSFSKEYRNLVNFIIKNKGYINPKLIPNEISDTNRYIIAKEKVKKDEILLFIPDDILISKLHKHIFSKCQDAYGLIEEYEFECVVYFMTIDKYNSSSIFKPYYDYLPKVNISDFVFSFTPEEAKMFEGTGITEGIRVYKFFLEKALEPVEEKLIKLAESKNIKFEQIKEEFTYNFIMVGTRNFGRPESILDTNTMVPYLDLINHSDKNNTYWFYDESKGRYVLTAMRDIEKDEEITDSYGHYMNSKLYETYGFVIPGNIYHDNVYVKINGETVTLNVGFLKSKIDSMYEKLVIMKKFEGEKAKDCILKSLNEKKEYYLKLKTNRFSMSVIIKEHLDIINEFMNAIQMYNFNGKN